MKTSKLLSLAGSLFFLSILFGSCKDDQHVAPAPNAETHTVHLELTANIQKDIAVTGNIAKGFTIDVTRSGNSKTEAINWSSDTWNNVNNKPKLLGVLMNSSTQKADNVWYVPSNAYDYNSAHGDKSAQVTIKYDINVTGYASNYKVIFYLTDDDRFTDVRNNTGSILFEGGAGVYDISGTGVHKLKSIEDNTFVEPNPRIYFNFIFRGDIDLSTYQSKGIKNFDMKPVGSLLMADFRPFNDDDELDNPAYETSFNPTLTTNAFDFTDRLNLLTNKGLKTATNDEYSTTVKFESYEDSGVSTSPITSKVNKISKTKPSPIYVKYVLPRDHAGFNIHISNNNIDLYRYASKSENFYDRFNTKTVAMDLKLSYGAIKTVADYKYNALSYVGEYNILFDENKNIRSFNTDQSNTNNTLFTFEEAKSVFSQRFLDGYHLPSIHEWISIVPYNGGIASYGPIEKEVEYSSGSPEDLNAQIGKAVLNNYTSAYLSVGENKKKVAYAIRFIKGKLIKDENGNDVPTEKQDLKRGNCPFLSLWRYCSIDNPNGDGKMLDVYCYVLPKSYTVKYGDHKLMYNDGTGWKTFTSEEFFKRRIGNGAFHRVFPATGDHTGGSTIGLIGNYWSSTEAGRTSSYSMYFDNGSPAAYSSNYKGARIAVRPFYYKPIE